MAIKHEYFYFPRGVKEREIDRQTWFGKNGLSSASVISHPPLTEVRGQEIPDIRMSRLMVASMLLEAWNAEKFFSEYEHDTPNPDEIDRMMQIAYLQFLGSFFGFLSGEEIRRIQQLEGQIPLSKFNNFNPQPLIEFAELKKLTKEWKQQGYKIVNFHGSFDPPTPLHLAILTEMYSKLSRRNAPVKIIVGLDGRQLMESRVESGEKDQAIPGETRPRYNRATCQEIFQSFWMVDQTYILSANSTADTDSYIRDYKQLGVDYVALSRQQPLQEKRLMQIEQAGAKALFAKHRHGDFSATKIMELFYRSRNKN